MVREEFEGEITFKQDGNEVIDSKQCRHCRCKGPEVGTHQMCVENGTESREQERERWGRGKSEWRLG